MKVYLHELWEYHEFLNRYVDFAFMIPIREETEYKNGRGVKSQTRDAINLEAVERKCDLYFALKRMNVREAVKLIHWFEAFYGIYLRDAQAVIRGLPIDTDVVPKTIDKEYYDG